MHAHRHRHSQQCVSAAAAAVDDDVDVDLYPFILRYKDGHVERLLRSPFVPASETPSSNRGVSTRDVVVDPSTGVSARLFLPSSSIAGNNNNKLPLVVYIHGGSFCTESAFCRTYHRYATSLAAAAGAVVVSVEYRLAPEHPIPAAYDDAWAALRWAASLADPWLADHADPARTFLAGDSAGGNIAFHTAVRASREIGVEIEGLVVVQPYFWGAERLPSEAARGEQQQGSAAVVLPADGVDKLWPFVTAGRAGNEDPRLNPAEEEVASLTCRRVLVAVAGKDTLRERGVRMFNRACRAAAAEATLVESEGEDHGFHLYSPLRETSRRLMDSIAGFINQQQSPEEEEDEEEDDWGWVQEAEGGKPIMLGVPCRPFRDIFDDGTKKSFTTACNYCMVAASYQGPWKIRRGKVNNYGLFVVGPVRPSKIYKGPAAAAALPGTRLVNNNFFF